jgi:hypothetical protein
LAQNASSMNGVSEMCTKDDCQESRAAGRVWCKAHAAEYMRFYRVSGLERANAQGFARGVQAMRELLMFKFASIRGTGGFTPLEVAGMIRDCEGPVQPPVEVSAG